jgi:hypothetical protein
MTPRARIFFSQATGSRARNIVRAVVPALVVLNVPWFKDLSADQVAAIALAVEVVFTGGAELGKRY